MRILIWPVLFVFLMLVQGAFSVFYTGWLAFDLPLLALYCYAMLRGEFWGTALGAGIGFLQDSMTVGVFGFHIFILATIGFFVGLTKEKVFKDNIYYHMSAIAVCAITQKISFLILELIRNDGHWSIILPYSWEVLGYILGNVLLVIPMLLLVKKVYDWIRQEDISY